MPEYANVTVSGDHAEIYDKDTQRPSLFVTELESVHVAVNEDSANTLTCTQCGHSFTDADEAQRDDECPDADESRDLFKLARVRHTETSDLGTIISDVDPDDDDGDDAALIGIQWDGDVTQGSVVTWEHPDAVVYAGHDVEAAPHGWLNFAGIEFHGRDTVTVTLSVGDPRGAFGMTIRRVPDDLDSELAGKLIMHVPHPGESFAHAPLRQIHPGTYVIGESE